MRLEHGGTAFEGEGHLLTADGDEPAREVVVVLAQQAHRDADVVDVVKHERALPSVLVASLEEGQRMLTPVPQRIQVVRRVVSVVEAEPVARNIDQGNARPKIRVWLVLVNKGVLSPVTDHQGDTEQTKGDDQNNDGGGMVEAPGSVDGSIGAQLPEARLSSQHRPAGTPEVAGQVQPDEEVEAAQVVQEIDKAVTLVAYGGREIVGPVALDMVVLDVVVEVAVPRVAHEGVHDIGEQRVEQGKATVQHAVLVDVLVLEQRVGPNVGGLHEHVQDGMGVAEAGEEHGGARQRGAKVDEQVRHKDDVSLDPGHAPRPRDVALERAVQKCRGRLKGLIEVVRGEDGWLEALIERVVERRQLGGCALLIDARASGLLC